MTTCNWPVDGERRCKHTGASPFFADLILCSQHRNLFMDALHHSIYRPEDRYEEAIQGTAQGALRKHAEKDRAVSEEQRRANSLVYFVERDGFVKIGHTSNLKRRLQQISSGSCLIEGMTVGPVELLATIDGAGPENERWLHQRFAHLCVGGEWFLAEAELRDFITSLQGRRPPKRRPPRAA